MVKKNVNKTNRYNTGQLGELLASKYLQKKGYIIKHKNWTCRWGEIDLIAVPCASNTKQAPEIVFVEVKYRTHTTLGEAHESINYYKKTAQSRAIKHYLIQNRALQKKWRFDVITIIAKPQLVLKHYQGIRLPLGTSKDSIFL